MPPVCLDRMDVLPIDSIRRKIRAAQHFTVARLHAYKTGMEPDARTTLVDRKHAIRLATLARRDALDPHWRAEASAAVAALGTKAIETGSESVVAGFWPIRSEIDLRPLLKTFRQRGARLTLPAIVDRETILFRQWRDDADLVDMGFGTRGPGDHAPVLEPTIILAPLAAFDRHGGRIGYGGGYYDRALARMAGRGLVPRLIGVAFSCQEVERVPTEPHDIPLREILTEKGLRALGNDASVPADA